MIITKQYRSQDSEDYYMIGDEEIILIMYSYAHGQNEVNNVDIRWSRWKDDFIKLIDFDKLPVHRIIKGIFK